MLLEQTICPPRTATRVELCGVLGAEIGGRRVAALPGRKGRLLFACLVIGRERPLSRDELIDAVWPHDAPVDPDAAFATLLTRLRAAIGPDVLRGRRELVLDLGVGAWVDWEVARDAVGAAEARLAAGDAGAALELTSAALEIARRPLLPGLSTPWIEDRRRDLVELQAALLETATRAALTLGGEHLPAAERSARELIEREPYRESAYALLMETHAARGNVAEALRVYDDLRRLLRDELGLTPSPPLTELAGRLLEQEAPTPAGNTTVPLPPAIAARQFAGEGEELRRRRPAGAAHVLAVTGAAGAGKSRLAAAAAACAHRDGHEVLHGRAQRDGVGAFEPFVGALRPRLAHCDAVARELAPVFAPELAELAHVLPELRSAAPDWRDAETAAPDVRLRRICDAVAALCTAMTPLMLVLEDLQWAGREAVLVLRQLTHATQGTGVTILLTLRDDEPLRPELQALLDDLARERLLDEISV